MRNIAIEPLQRELGCAVEYVGRDTNASPTAGSCQIYLREQRS